MKREEKEVEGDLVFTVEKDINNMTRLVEFL